MGPSRFAWPNTRENEATPGDRLQHRPLRLGDPGRGLAEPQMEQRQASGRLDRVPRRQKNHPSVGRPPGQSRQRDRAPVVRDVGLVHQPELSPRSSSSPSPASMRSRSKPAETPRRDGRLAPPRQGRREAHQDDAGAGEVPRRAAERTVQGGVLSVLRGILPPASCGASATAAFLPRETGEGDRPKGGGGGGAKARWPA